MPRVPGIPLAQAPTPFGADLDQVSGRRVARELDQASGMLFALDAERRRVEDGRASTRAYLAFLDGSAALSEGYADLDPSEALARIDSDHEDLIAQVTEGLPDRIRADVSDNLAIRATTARANARSAATQRLADVTRREEIELGERLKSSAIDGDDLAVEEQVQSIERSRVFDESVKPAMIERFRAEVAVGRVDKRIDAFSTASDIAGVRQARAEAEALLEGVPLELREQARNAIDREFRDEMGKRSLGLALRLREQVETATDPATLNAVKAQLRGLVAGEMLSEGTASDIQSAINSRLQRGASDRETIEAFETRLREGRTTLADQDDMDKWWQFKGAAEWQDAIDAAPPEQKVAVEEGFITNLARQSRLLPKAVRQQFEHDAMSGSPAAASRAATLFKRVQKAQPSVVANMSGDVVAVLNGISAATNELGIADEKAVSEIRESLTIDAVARRERKSRLYDSLDKVGETPSDNLMAAVVGKLNEEYGFDPWFGGALSLEDVPIGLREEVARRAEREFSVHLKADVAVESAARGLSTVWGSSRVGAKSVPFMYAPPEKFAEGFGGDSDAMNENLASEVLAGGFVAPRDGSDLVPVANFGYEKDDIASRLRVNSDSETLRRARKDARGQSVLAPSYSVTFFDKDDQEHPLVAKDGTPLRWYPISEVQQDSRGLDAARKQRRLLDAAEGAIPPPGDIVPLTSLVVPE